MHTKWNARHVNLSFSLIAMGRNVFMRESVLIDDKDIMQSSVIFNFSFNKLLCRAHGMKSWLKIKVGQKYRDLSVEKEPCLFAILRENLDFIP